MQVTAWHHPVLMGSSEALHPPCLQVRDSTLGRCCGVLAGSVHLDDSEPAELPSSLSCPYTHAPPKTPIQDSLLVLVLLPGTLWAEEAPCNSSLGLWTVRVHESMAASPPTSRGICPHSQDLPPGRTSRHCGIAERE